MKITKRVRAILIMIAAATTLSALSGCVVVPARGYYGGPVVVHAWVR